MPKRPPSPFTTFCKVNHGLVRRDNPELSFAEVSEVLSSRWEKLAGDEKLSFENDAAVALAAYDAAVENYNAAMAVKSAAAAPQHVDHESGYGTSKVLRVFFAGHAGLTSSHQPPLLRKAPIAAHLLHHQRAALVQQALQCPSTGKHCRMDQGLSGGADDGGKCRRMYTGSGDSSTSRTALSENDEHWFRDHCRELFLYTVKIAAGTNHSGFAVVPVAPLSSTPMAAKGGGEEKTSSSFSDTTFHYINFGAEGLYHLPKWDLSAAKYVPLHVVSTDEVAVLESNHTRAKAGVYFWLTNCCHHNTDRELRRLGFDTDGARSTTWFDETKVSRRR